MTRAVNVLGRDGWPFTGLSSRGSLARGSSQAGAVTTGKWAARCHAARSAASDASARVVLQEGATPQSRRHPRQQGRGAS
eukprot:7212876-Alexandrium_andersonii.AAC.1